MPQSNTWSITDDLQVTLIVGDNVTHYQRNNNPEGFSIRVYFGRAFIDLTYANEIDRDSVYNQLDTEINPKDMAP